MPQNKLYDQRLQLRIDEVSKANSEKMAADLNVPFLHFCTMSLGIGASVLHRQVTAIQNIPDTAWESMAKGFTMSEETLMKAMEMLIEKRPDLIAGMDAIDSE